tara:strand:+ start:4108 stop:4359 length:252 start_codon:yes stop_codon:yes gene_type:complete
MELPKFLVGDSTDAPDTVFIIHTEVPRFVLNLDTDEIKWLDEDLSKLLGTDDESELTTMISSLVSEADDFYQREIDRYDQLED